MAEAPQNKGGMTVRQRAEQDLQILRARVAEAEAALLKLKEEEQEQAAFLKHLERYEPERGSTLPEAMPVFFFHGLGEEGHANIQDKDRLKTNGSPRVFHGGPIQSLRMLPRSPYPDVHVMPGRVTRQRRVADFVHKALSLLDGKFSTKSLVDLIRHEKELFPMLGTNPAATLSSYLSRDGRFVFERGDNGGWRLANQFEFSAADQDRQGEGEQDQKGGVST